MVNGYTTFKQHGNLLQAFVIELCYKTHILATGLKITAGRLVLVFNQTQLNQQNCLPE